MNALRRAVALASLLLPSLVFAADPLPVPPYQARYEVFASGFAVGEAIITLSAPKPGAYRMSADARPNRLAAILASSRVHEQVSGELQEGAIRPRDYERQLEAAKKSEHMQLTFDWAAGQLQARNNAERATLPLTPGVVDPLSLQLMVMRDLRSGRLPDHYSLVDKTEIKTYQIRNLGQETLNTSLGKLKTTRINQFTPGKTRMTTFWVAPDLHYLLVRISQEKRGKEELRMEIRSVDR